MKTKMIILTLVYVSVNFIFFSSAEEGLRQCGEPFHTVDLSKFEVEGCASDRACEVDHQYTEITVYVHYTAKKDYPPSEQYLRGRYIGNRPFCEMLITSPSQTFQPRCFPTLVLEKGNSEMQGVSFGSIKKGDQFYFACHCTTWKGFQKGESGKFNMTLWIKGNAYPSDTSEKEMVPYGDCVKGDLSFIYDPMEHIDSEEQSD